MEGDPAAEGTPELERITERLESLARELDSEPDEERAAELVREASELATQAGHEVDRVLRAADDTRES
ncbi:MAG: hypothetical protein M3M99_03935 [Actinomycetota bacterium]|nr:hypothetical protein [Actinomycetota bacterium]